MKITLVIGMMIKLKITKNPVHRDGSEKAEIATMMSYTAINVAKEDEAKSSSRANRGKKVAPIHEGIIVSAAREENTI